MATVIPPELKELQAAYQSGRWSTDLLDTIRTLTLSNPHADTLLLLLDVTHAFQGISSDEIALCRQLMNDGNLNDPRLHWRLASCEYTLENKLDYAASLLTGRLALPRRLTALGSRVSDYPLLLAAMGEDPTCRHQLSFEDNRLVSTAESLCRRLTPLDELIEEWQAPEDDVRVSVAVIGNGPTALEADNAHWIDSADRVVRFNNTALNHQNRSTLGSRTDVWVMSPSTRLKYMPDDTSDCAIAGVRPFERPSRYWTGVARTPVPALATFNEHHWYSLVRKLEAPPTAGLLTLTELNQSTTELQIQSTGFTVLSTHNDANHHSDSEPASGRHNWPEERALLRSLIVQEGASDQNLQRAG